MFSSGESVPNEGSVVRKKKTHDAHVERFNDGVKVKAETKTGQVQQLIVEASVRKSEIEIDELNNGI